MQSSIAEQDKSESRELKLRKSIERKEKIKILGHSASLRIHPTGTLVCYVDYQIHPKRWINFKFKSKTCNTEKLRLVAFIILIEECIKSDVIKNKAEQAKKFGKREDTKPDWIELSLSDSQNQPEKE